MLGLENRQLVELGARRSNPAHRGDEKDAPYRAGVVGVRRAAVGRQPRLQPRRAVPRQAVEVVAYRVKAMPPREIADEDLKELEPGPEPEQLVDL